MKEDTTVISFRHADSIEDPLTEIAREGARRMLAEALKAEADAFVAASFVTFPAASHLAFVTLGPMVDIKLIGLYAVTFRRRLLARVIVVPIVLVFLLSWLFGVLA